MAVRGRPPKIDVTESVKGKEYTMEEIGAEHQPIERVSENDFVAESQLEAFMAEPVTIQVHSTMIAGDLDIILPSVNGVNQPIVRDVPQVVKRKYVEILARALITKPKQKIRDMNDQSSLFTFNESRPSYPFSIMEDKNPNGRPWLESIVASAQAEAQL